MYKTTARTTTTERYVKTGKAERASAYVRVCDGMCLRVDHL